MSKQTNKQKINEMHEIYKAFVQTHKKFNELHSQLDDIHSLQEELITKFLSLRPDEPTEEGMVEIDTE